MRLFIAITPPPLLLDAVVELIGKLAHTRADVRWVEREKLHITVKFLGETEEGLVPEIGARMARAAAEVVQFPLDLNGLSRFPDRGQARVIVADVASPDQRLTKLHRLIDSGMGGMGLPMDVRVLVPHLTLGRVSSNHGLNRLLRLVDKLGFHELGAFAVKEVTLFESVMGAEGAVYRALHTASLAVKAEAPVAPGT